MLTISEALKIPNWTLETLLDILNLKNAKFKQIV